MKSKRLVLTFIALGIILFVPATGQTPQAFKYQTVVRNGSGEIIADQSVSFRMSIRDFTAGGPVIYSETHNVTTNTFGLAVLNIGSGVPVTGIFSAINWGSGIKFLETEFDPAGGSSYIAMGTTQLLSVPYALYSENTANNDDADADPANELQTLTIDGNNLLISEGNSVTLPTAGESHRIIDEDSDTWVNTEQSPDNDRIVFSTSGSQRMVIEAGGNVNVDATLTADYLAGDGSLLVNVPGDHLGNHTAGQNIVMGNHWISHAGSDNGITIGPSGVGVNVANPNFPLTVAGTIRAGGGKVLADFGTPTDPGFQFGSGFEAAGLSSPYYNSVSIITNGAERVTVNMEGEVGIGISSPEEQLHVLGSIRMADGNQATGRVMVSDAYGTGVWTSPEVLSGNEWHLSGNSGTIPGTHFLGTLDNQPLDIRTNNILHTRFSGKGQIEVLNTGQSVFIGEGAGNGDDLTDNANTLIGFHSGFANTSGYYNTTCGSWALSNNISGNSNSAVGVGSLLSNTTGSNNTSVGLYALSLNTSGYYNTAIGHEALYFNTAGNNGTAIGTYAMRYANNTTTTYINTNVAVGYEALRGSPFASDNTGTENTAVGYQSLLNNKSGYLNTALVPYISI